MRVKLGRRKGSYSPEKTKKKECRWEAPMTWRKTYWISKYLYTHKIHAFSSFSLYSTLNAKPKGKNKNKTLFKSTQSKNNPKKQKHRKQSLLLLLRFLLSFLNLKESESIFKFKNTLGRRREMVAGVDSSDPATVAGIAMDFPVSDEAAFVSPPRVPPRLRRRLVESRSPSTAEEIEAKLRDADRRRQVVNFFLIVS